MDFGAGIALIAAAVNLSMGVLHVAVARAPGWRIARLFSAIAFTAGAYNISSLILCINGLPDAAYISAGNLAYLTATLHGVCWILYAYADEDGSLHAVPNRVQWLAVAVVALCAMLAGTGQLLYPKIGLVYVALVNGTYHYPLPTKVGEVYGYLAIVLAGFAFARLAGRFRQGERSLGWQLGFYAILLLCATEEVLVANRVVNLPSVLDFGFVLVVMPLTLHTIRRIIADARVLQLLSGYLKGEVERRTEERDEVRKTLRETQEDLREVVSSLDEIVWEADAQSLSVSSVSVGAAKLLGYPSGDDVIPRFGRVTSTPTIASDCGRKRWTRCNATKW